MFEYIVISGALVNAVGIYSYVRDTLLGTTKPNRITWLFWAIAPFIATAGAFTDGFSWTTLPVLVAGVGPLLVFVSSFANGRGYWKLGVFDYLCGSFSALALILWALTREASVAIAFAIACDLMATMPTLAKSWTNPDSESGLAFSAGLYNAFTSLLVMRVWNFPEYGFPIYLIITYACLLFCIYRNKLGNLSLHKLSQTSNPQ